MIHLSRIGILGFPYKLYEPIGAVLLPYNADLPVTNLGFRFIGVIVALRIENNFLIYRFAGEKLHRKEDLDKTKYFIEHSEFTKVGQD